LLMVSIVKMISVSKRFFISVIVSMSYRFFISVIVSATAPPVMIPGRRRYYWYRSLRVRIRIGVRVVGL
jgi:hypothetical protein